MFINDCVRISVDYLCLYVFIYVSWINENIRKIMKEYFKLMCYVCDNGVKKEDRIGIGILSVFGY